MEYILVSVPATPSRADAKKVLNNGTSQRDLSTNATFSIPQLRVGTLDSLVALTDDLARTDQFVENVTKKIANYMGELLSADKKQLVEHLVLGDNSATPDAYIRGFEWDTARYNVQLSIRELSDTIAQQMTHVDQEMKGRVTAYSKVKGSLQAIERKATGSLLVRSLAGVVDSRFFVKDSEYMTTLLVVVPRAAYKVWERSYESLNEYVVPRSSELVTEDAEYGLFTVTVFRKMVEDFKQTARENKFIVREYEFDAESDAAGEVEKAALKTDIMKKYKTLVQWCGASFGDAFSSWIHIKALRVFVESLLRYGLPPNFHVAVLRVPTRGVKKLRTALGSLYASLDSSGSGGGADATIDIPGLGQQQQYYPYVSFDVGVKEVLAALE